MTAAGVALALEPAQGRWATNDTIAARTPWTGHDWVSSSASASLSTANHQLLSHHQPTSRWHIVSFLHLHGVYQKSMGHPRQCMSQVRVPVPLPPGPLSRALGVVTVVVLTVFGLELLIRSSQSVVTRAASDAAAATAAAAGGAAGQPSDELLWRPAPPGTGVSIVVPTYHEADNVRALAQRVFLAAEQAGMASDVELLLVDDSSNDGTVEIVRALRNEHPDHDVNVIVRTPEEGTGLSSAVILGILKAKHELCVVMDADLSHPPEAVPEVAGWLSLPEPRAAAGSAGAGGSAIVSGAGVGAAPATAGTPTGDGTAGAPRRIGAVDFVLGSRYADGGGVSKEWPVWRRIVSGGATLLARPLTAVSDPMSGFFGIRKATLAECSGINAVGFKIGLELLSKCRIETVAEVPFTFRDRVAGTSKLKFKTALLYASQLVSLYLSQFAFTAYAAAACKLALLVYGVWRVRHRQPGDDWRPQLGAVALLCPNPLAALRRDGAAGGKGSLLPTSRQPPPGPAAKYPAAPIGVTERRCGCVAWQAPAFPYVSVFGGVSGPGKQAA